MKKNICLDSLLADKIEEISYNKLEENDKKSTLGKGRKREGERSTSPCDNSETIDSFD